MSIIIETACTGLSLGLNLCLKKRGRKNSHFSVRFRASAVIGLLMVVSTMSVTFDATKVVRDNYRDVWNFLRLLGCDRSRADDFTQETFLAVLRSPFDDFNPKATAAYLRNVARYIFLNSLRKEDRRKAREMALVAEDVWQDFVGDDGGDGRVEALKKCLQKLEERSRKMLEMRYKDNKSTNEIMLELSLSESATNTSIHRAKESLKSCVEPE